MTPQEIFIARLRRHRERSQVTLDDIATATLVKRELLERFERNDLSAWPKGVYARAWVRAYATAVGLDPGDTVEEFCRLFPQGDRRTGGTLQGMAAIVAHPSEYRDEFTHVHDRRRQTDASRPAIKPAWQDVAVAMTRAMWARLTSLSLPALRIKRSPRITS